MHTKGPWLYRGKSDSVHEACETHPYGRQIFKFNEGFNADGLPSDDDLSLILAAPELLSDLKEAAQLLRNYEKLHREKGTEDGLTKADRNRAWAEQFEATIAKATSNSN